MPTAPKLSCSGKVTFIGAGLDNVVIQSDVKEYTTTNIKGEFNFTTNAKTLRIYPVKEGYIFEPSEVEVSSGENTNINFVAIEVQKLKGVLTLAEIIITPTCIMASPDNYVYTSEGKECLKANEISLFYNNTSYTVNNGDVYLYKNINNTINAENTQISFNCNQCARIGVLINTYFSLYNQEFETTYTEYSYLDINRPQTNANLNNGQVIYNIYGINNKARAFTFDITFVFNFIES